MRQMLLHTEAFEHRCLSTQKHVPRDALTYTRLCTQKLFRHRLFFRESQKLWPREAFTQRIFYTQKLLHTHTSVSTEAFTQRSFWAQELLHTDAFTHRSLYTEAFTHRSFYIFYTEKPLHTDAFPQKNRFHRAAFTHFKKSQFCVSFWRPAIIWCERVASGVGKSQFLTLDNHFAWNGCAWPCKIAI